MIKTITNGSEDKPFLDNSSIAIILKVNIVCKLLEQYMSARCLVHYRKYLEIFTMYHNCDIVFPLEKGKQENYLT